MRIRTHPGEILLEEFLKPYAITPHALALSIHVPASRIADIINSKRKITPDTATRLSKFFGTTPQFWLNLQNSYDLSVLNSKCNLSIENIVPFDSIKEQSNRINNSLLTAEDI